MERLYAGVFALIGWFAVVGQAFAGDHLHSFGDVVDYFSYFTILSNILVALTLTSAAVAPSSPVGRFLLRPATALATVVYITITGITYYFLLAALYDLSGWVKTFDHLLHYVMPPAFVVFWLVFVPKGMLHLGNILWMLVPPLLYGAYTLLHGPFSGFYPYPFIDVSKLGYPQTLINIGRFLVFFSLMGCVYWLVDRVIGHLRRPANA